MAKVRDYILTRNKNYFPTGNILNGDISLLVSFGLPRVPSTFMIRLAVYYLEISADFS